MADISKINNGTTTYDIKDAVSRAAVTTTGSGNDVVHKSGAETISGVKTFSGGIVASTIQQSSSSYLLSLYGGNGNHLGAKLVLNGKDNSSEPGTARIEASDGTNTQNLRCYPNGNLNWEGSTVTGSGFAKAGMPSSSYVSNVFTAFDTAYSNSKSGFIYASVTATAVPVQFTLRAGALSMCAHIDTVGWGSQLSLPVAAGTSCEVSISGSGSATISSSRYVYANAE